MSSASPLSLTSKELIVAETPLTSTLVKVTSSAPPLAAVQVSVLLSVFTMLPDDAVIFSLILALVYFEKSPCRTMLLIFAASERLRRATLNVPSFRIINSSVALNLIPSPPPKVNTAHGIVRLMSRLALTPTGIISLLMSTVKLSSVITVVVMVIIIADSLPSVLNVNPPLSDKSEMVCSEYGVVFCRSFPVSSPFMYMSAVLLVSLAYP